MKIFHLVLALAFFLLSQTALSKAKDIDAKVAELNIKIAKSIIHGKGKVGKDISAKEVVVIAWELESKQNQPQLAWNLIVKTLKENPKIQGDEKWMLLDTLIDSANKLNKKQISISTVEIAIEMIKTGGLDNKFSLLPIRNVYLLAGKYAQNLRYELIYIYANKLVADARSQSFNFKSQEDSIPWAFDMYYDLDLGSGIEKDRVKMLTLERARYRLAKEYLTYLRSSPLTKDEKLHLSSGVIRASIYHESLNQARDLVAIAEPMLYVESSDQEATTNQIIVLAGLMPRDDYYLGTKKPEDLFEFIEKLSRNVKSADAKFGSAMFLGNAYSEKGSFEKADIQFKIALENIDPKYLSQDLARGLRFVINMLQLKSLYARGNLNQVIQKTPAAYSESKWFLKEYLKNYPRMVSMAGGLSVLIEIETFLGNYKDAITIGEQVLSALDKGRREGYDVNVAIIQTTNLLEVAYQKNGNEAKADEMRDLAFKAELRLQKVPTVRFIKWYMVDINYGDYDGAEDALKRIENNIQYASRDSDVQVYKNFLQVSRQLISDLKKSGKNQKELLLQKNCGNLLDILETQLYEIKATGNARMYLDTLGYTYSLATCSGDKSYAGYISKIYINALQELRADLSNNKQQLGVFTAAQGDTLKNFVNNFYEIGDFQAAQLTMRVLKENEFLEFLNTRSDKDLVLSKIEYSTLEREFNLKKEQIEREIQSLQLAYNNAKDLKEQSLIQSAISEKFNNLKILSNRFKQNLQKAYANTEVRKDYGVVKISANEAQLDYVIEKNKISLYIYTSKSVKNYSFDVSRDLLRSQILELNLALTKRQIPKAGLIALLSKELMIDKINALKDENIKTLKIRSDDLLPIIPLALMTSSKGAIGENFNLIFLGLGKNESSSGLGDSMAAFGVTKSYQQYSALPFVKEEILGLQEMTLPKGRNLSRKVFLDSTFTKSALISSFDKGDSYLHIATHYSVPGRRNNAGQLLLGDGSTFSLTDIRNEIKGNNKIQLVTLSACDTGIINKAQSSSNLEALSNVLNLKGAKAVMGTLWPISDEATALFMRLFYGLIFKGGHSSEEALRLTQSAFSRGSLSAIKDGSSMVDGNTQEFDAKLKKYTNPFYWAAFQIVGS